MSAYIIVTLVAYLLGSISFSVIISKKMAGFDVREKGSGNAGTTNMLRSVGKKAAAITLICDILKGVISIVIAIIVGNIAKNLDRELLLQIAGIAVVLGHTFPIFFGFKGGKGIACTTGVILAFHWQMAPLCIGLFIVVVLLTQYVSLGSILLVSVFFIELLLFGQTGHLPVADTYLPEIYVLGGIFTLMAIWRHRANIKRLLSGTENKLNLFKKK